ncbi:hypothetical protein [Nonomuraea ferruginea]|uniref:Uncharacterized protein n=1 Tax=Nonomuraea ferruginea TaxID=46174 RepID=A0ABT4SQF1_9ACTN|nr:hypothetical protein [Nonomuraea ferruginea]MDA0639486.1 hypothetical protein [Nonomuraea ferruginea]
MTAKALERPAPAPSPGGPPWPGPPSWGAGATATVAPAAVISTGPAAVCATGTLLPAGRLWAPVSWTVSAALVESASHACKWVMLGRRMCLRFMT